MLNGKNKNFGLNSNVLKLLAIISMTFDHIGFYAESGRNFGYVFRCIGRLAFPIFAYFIAEGCKYTHNKPKYLLTVLGEGLICLAVYIVFLKDYYFNVLLTFAFSIGLIYCLQNIKDKRNLCLSVFGIVGIIVSVILISYCDRIFGKRFGDLDYRLFGVLLPVAVYFMPKKIYKLLAVAIFVVLIYLDYQYFSVKNYDYSYMLYALATPFVLAFYNGKRGKLKLKYLFYIYYPLHLVVIYGIFAYLIW